MLFSVLENKFIKLLSENDRVTDIVVQTEGKVIISWQSLD